MSVQYINYGGNQEIARYWMMERNLDDPKLAGEPGTYHCRELN